MIALNFYQQACLPLPPLMNGSRQTLFHLSLPLTQSLYHTHTRARSLSLTHTRSLSLSRCLLCGNECRCSPATHIHRLQMHKNYFAGCILSLCLSHTHSHSLTSMRTNTLTPHTRMLTFTRQHRTNILCLYSHSHFL